MDLSGLERFARFTTLPDWRLTTAEILQKHDLAPRFPALAGFLDFWRREIDGPLHSVRVASAALTRPAELRYANGQFLLN